MPRRRFYLHVENLQSRLALDGSTSAILPDPVATIAASAPSTADINPQVGGLINPLAPGFTPILPPPPPPLYNPLTRP